MKSRYMVIRRSKKSWQVDEFLNYTKRYFSAWKTGGWVGSKREAKLLAKKLAGLYPDYEFKAVKEK